MATPFSQTLHKKERVCGRKQVERLFCEGNSCSLSAFPVRMVYICSPKEEVANSDGVAAKILVSVSKRKFKHAVKRNRVKRQLREAYRKNKYLLLQKVPEGQTLIIGFLWQDTHLHDSKEVESKVINLLKRVAEKL